MPLHPELLNLNKRSFEYHLSVLVQERRPANVRGVDHCCQSGVCCWKSPGWLTQQDLSRMAVARNMTPREFFLTFCVVDPSPGVNVPLLRRKHQEAIAGTYLSTLESYSIQSPCVFLADDSSCSVHAIKPESCKNQGCWYQGTPVKATWTRAELLDLGWDGVEE